MLRALRTYVNACARCGGFPIYEDLIFCRSCWQSLQRLMAPSKPLHYIDHCGVQAAALLLWDSRSDHLVRKLVYGLKGGGEPATYLALASAFVVANAKQIGSQRPLFIPAPPAKAGAIDHASALASALAEVCSGEVFPIFERSGQGSQKRRRKRERAGVALSVRQDCGDIVGELGRRNCQWIFVDDVITTGATARAAFEVLNRPAGFSAWVLAYRALAGNPLNLL